MMHSNGTTHTRAHMYACYVCYGNITAEAYTRSLWSRGTRRRGLPVQCTIMFTACVRKAPGIYGIHPPALPECTAPEAADEEKDATSPRRGPRPPCTQ